MRIKKYIGNRLDDTTSLFFIKVTRLTHIFVKFIRTLPTHIISISVSMKEKLEGERNYDCFEGMLAKADSLLFPRSPKK